MRELISKEGLGELLGMLRAGGYDIIGPSVRDGAIVLGPIEGLQDLPAGMTDEQAPGSYRLRERGDGALFGYAVGPHSYKRELLAPTLRLFRVRRSKDDMTFETEPATVRKRVLLGVRACELAAMSVQDRVLLGGPFADADYAQRRRDVLVIAVQCSEAGGTCFCVSMGTGPAVRAGFDLALTELEGPHRFVVDVGSEAGRDWLSKIARREASPEECAQADAVVARTAGSMGRELETRDIGKRLTEAFEHPRWDAVADRCLGCANCTMVCPTCFCTTTEDRMGIDGESAERVRRWDSCFTIPFTHMPGGSVRTSLRSRYRQWLTHKLATWIEQFGTSGCVGCGRCITWCPVGIDLTEEAAALCEQTSTVPNE